MEEEKIDPFAIDQLQLRRADYDDATEIQKFIDESKRSAYMRMFGTTETMNLIESSFLSITVLTPDGKIVAFASVDHSPYGLKGQYDKKHYNKWEDWIPVAFDASEYIPYNTLWITFFVCSEAIDVGQHQEVFKRILQSVYSSLPELNGLLFLLRGEITPEDEEYCFTPVVDIFKEVAPKKKEVISNVKGIHIESRLFYNPRVKVLPYMEVRIAKQEDHDDLAEVFNQQSEMNTDRHCEFYIAEMIAGQNETQKALVAQVKDKAVGLMEVTKDADIHMLHQCFKLESYDNLLKPDFMDAIRKRRDVIRLEKLKIEEENRKEELRRLKEETIKCNIISQRVELQEFCKVKESNIMKIIEDAIYNAESTKLSKESVEKILDDILEGFKLRQPSDYFINHPTDDTELVCNIQTEREFLISTLNLFGLPEKYMEGEGHFADLGKKSEEEKAKAKKRSIAKKIKEKKESQRKKNTYLKVGQKAEGIEKPTFFDLNPFLQAFRLFVAATGEARSQLRRELKKKPRSVLESIFVDEDNVFTFKKCVDLMTFGKKLVEREFDLSPQVAEVVGYMLLCFGEIAYDKHDVWKMPEELQKEDDKEIDPLLAKLAKRQQAKKEQEEKEAPKQVKVTLFDTSIHDFLQAIEKMQDYDYTLYQLGMMKADIDPELHTGDEEVVVEEEKKEEVKEEEKKEDDNKEDDQEIFGGSEMEEDDIQVEQEEEVNVSSVSAEKKEVKREARKVEKRIKTPEVQYLYAKDPEYEEIVKDLNDLDTIPEAPDRAKNAFAITIFILEAAFESRGCDFLQFAFDLFPDKDYMIISQPHNIPESSLLKNFAFIEKKAESTFSHVLYILHRDYLLGNQLKVRIAEPKDYEKTKKFLEPLFHKKDMTNSVYEVLVKNDPTKQCLLTTLNEEIMGLGVVTKDVNLPYYQSHFHIQDYMFLREHERLGHKKIDCFVMNPIFEKYSRFFLREIMRLTSASALYLELNETSVIPTLMPLLIHVKSRRFPHFLKKKWNHERYDFKETTDYSKDHDGGDRDPLDEMESTFSLFLTTKRLLSEAKIVNNSRIVVVGASDTGVSFVEALLTIKYIHFSNITLLAPGGFPQTNAADPKYNYTASSTAYGPEEIQNLILESRIKVLNSRMIDIDRQQKSVVLYDESVLPYDILVLTMGLQEKTLQSLGYVSRGIAPIPTNFLHLDGLISLDDPYLYQHLRPGGTILSMLAHKKHPERCVIYGRGLGTLCCIQGLINRGVRPSMITLAIPDLYSLMSAGFDSEEEVQAEEFSLNPKACYDPEIEAILLGKFEEQKVQILRDVALKKIIEDERGQIETLIFEKIGFVPEEKNLEKEDEEGPSSSHNGEEVEKEGDEEDLSEVKVNCRVLITGGHKDVDVDVFNALHNNSLVYNGRLIVDANFQTNDQSIYAGGSLCAFSGKYSAFAAGRSLNMHHYSGREIGLRMASHLIEQQYPHLASIEQSSLLEEAVPIFNLPVGMGGVVASNLFYYYIRTPLSNPLETPSSLVCNNLGADLKGTYIKFTFNELGIIDSVLYLGSEKIVLQSLESLVGLHGNYLNKIRERFDKKIVPNAMEFLSENWAIALYHDWFAEFTSKLKREIQNTEELQKLLGKVSDDILKGKKFNKEKIDKIVSKIDPKTIKYIEDSTVAYIRANQNHLPMYYVPGTEFK